jgi:DNA-binding LacI/PurR family transcriptional regulator
MSARVTMADVAEAAGVSRALVSLAYRDAFGVNGDTRQRILDVGDQLGYVHNRIAASLASGGATSIGVYLQDLHNDFFADVHDGIRDVVETEGRDLVLAVGALGGERDAGSLRALQGARVGVIIGAGILMPDTRVQAFSARTPLVSIAREVPGVDSVSSDNLAGGRLATSHLLELGHRRIVMLANPPSDGYLGRRTGYEEEMTGAGLAPHAVEVSYSRDDAATAAAALLDGDDAPTAFFAHNDQTALGVLEVLLARGITPGREVSVIGYDNSSVSSAPGTSLTSVDLHGAQLGAAAGRAALRRLADPAAPPSLEVTSPELVPRTTTGPASE